MGEMSCAPAQPPTTAKPEAVSVPPSLASPGLPLTRLPPRRLSPQSAKLGTVLRSLGFTPTEADVEDMQSKAGASVNFDALLGFIT